MSDEIVIGGDMEDIPAGTYPATLKSIETKYSEKFGGEFRVWQFELENGSTVEGSSSTKTNSKSKPGKWIAALLGRVPAQGEKVELIGRPCLVQVIDKDGWPAVETVLPPLKLSSVPTAVSGVHSPPEFTEPAALPELP